MIESSEDGDANRTADSQAAHDKTTAQQALKALGVNQSDLAQLAERAGEDGAGVTDPVRAGGTGSHGWESLNCVR